MFDGGEAIRKLALNVARYSGAAPLAKQFVGGIGAILMLHHVTAAPDKPLGINRHLNVAPDFLDAVITDMKASGYSFVSLDEAIMRITQGGEGGLFATITADDAYRDNFVEALPVLERHAAPLTVYVAPALIDGTSDLWWDVIEDIVTAQDQLTLETPAGTNVLPCSTTQQKLEANRRLQDYLTLDVAEEDQRAVLHQLAKSAGVDPTAPARDTVMNWDEIRQMAAHPLVTIGAHTINHFNLKRLSQAKAQQEIGDVIGVLESKLGKKPKHLAYPYGFARAVGCREVDMAKLAGYASAVTTRHGLLRAEHARHLHALPRISVNGCYQDVGYIRTMLSGITTPLANRGKLLVTV